MLELLSNCRRSVLALTGVLVFIALFELVVRLSLSYNAPFDERHLSSLKYLPSGVTRQNMINGQVVFALDSQGRLRRDSILYRVNQSGYRGKDWTIDSGALRIAILGGSHVFDIHAYEGTGRRSWPEIIEIEMHKRGANVQVFNLGVPGAATPEIVSRTLYDLSDLSPQFVILNSTWNDLKWIANYSRPLSSLTPGAMQPNPFIEKVTFFDEIFGWSVVYRKCRDAYYRWKYEIKNADGPIELLSQKNGPQSEGALLKGLQQYELNLKAFVGIVRSMHAEPILAIEERMVAPNNTKEQMKRIRYDFISSSMDHAHLVRLYTACDSIIVRVGRELNVRVIDLNPYLQFKADSLFADHVHTTQAGSEVLARGYAEFLFPILSSQGRIASPNQSR